MKSETFNRIPSRMSSHDDFRDERIDAPEMYDMLGGIERTGMIVANAFGNPAFESVWDVKYPDEDIYSPAADRNIPAKNNFFRSPVFPDSGVVRLQHENSNGKN
ncbi:MAG: hypothetical protein LBP64_04980 [Tannerella sp.]|jgi:hypothetical protein|nr:hypothetical protein [Tannerella sp.]